MGVTHVMKVDKSNYNISVFTTYPHADVPSDDEIIGRIRHQAKIGFKPQTGLPNEWEGKTVIEFGCGSGLKLLPLALRGARIVGIDGSSRQIERMKRHAQLLDVKGEFHVSRLEDVDPKSVPPADLVVCSAVLHHVHEWKKLIAIMAQCLRSGGYIYLTWCDWTLHLSGFNLKNQIAYRLGWSPASRLAVGKLLFGWWDKNRNTMGISQDSFFADLYSAYYIPLSFSRVRRVLEETGIEILNALPPHTAAHYVAYHEFSGQTSRFLPVFKRLNGTHWEWLLNGALRIRHYTVAKHGPRIVSGRKK